MPPKSKTKSEVITINKTTLNIDNFDNSIFKRLTAEEQHELLLETYKLMKQCFIRV